MIENKSGRPRLTAILAIILTLLCATRTYAAEPAPDIPAAYSEPIQTNELDAWPEGPAVYAESAILMDVDTGTILYEKNIDAEKYPASITKIMTALLAIENSRPEERVVFSDNAIWGIERNSSHIGIRIGENLSMEDCLYGIMLESANEVCLAVAEHIAGSVDDFVEMMNQKAASLGCENTHFSNPNGLPAEDHYTSAHDMALIAQSAYQNEQFRELCSTRVHQIGWTNRTGEDRWLLNHHKMLRDDTAFYYEGCQGGKTGYTEVALNTLVTYATRNDLNLVCVTMRTSGQQVYTDTAALLDYGFGNFVRIAAPAPDEVTGAYSGFSQPRFFPGFDWPKTAADSAADSQVTLPLDSSSSDLELSTVIAGSTLTRSYSYHGYLVKTKPQLLPDGLLQLLHEPPALRITLPANATTIGGTFQNLPAWKYPLLIFLIFAVCFYGCFITLKIIKRKSRRNN